MKRLVTLIILAMLSSSSLMAMAEVRTPQWSDFCPEQYLNAKYKDDYYSIPKNALLIASIVGIPFHIKCYYGHLEQQRINYWAVKRKSFERNLEMCRLQEDANKQDICYLKLTDNLENEIYNNKVAAEQAQRQALDNAVRNLNTSVHMQQINNNLNNINNSIKELEY